MLDIHFVDIFPIDTFSLYIYVSMLSIILYVYNESIVGSILFYLKCSYNFCVYKNKTKALKSYIFKIMVNSPLFLKDTFEKEILEFTNKIKDDIDTLEKNIFRSKSLPYYGIDSAMLIDKLDSMKQNDDSKYQHNKISGALYNTPSSGEMTLVTDILNRYYKTNPLHSDIFPSLITMEKDIIHSCKPLFNLPKKQGTGTLTTGGTESIFLALYTYREYGKKFKNIISPEIVAPRSVHPAFDKGCYYLGIKLNKIDIDNSNNLDIHMLKSHINYNTILLVGSAPSFPHGLMDNISLLSKIAQNYSIPLHVDACLGGFVLPFLGLRRVKLGAFDFSLKGVTSISTDTHKYGCCPKGSSVLLFRDKKMFESCYFVQNDWMGGLYATTNMTGSRAGLNIAWTWALLNNIGFKQFTEQAKHISDMVIKVNDAFSNSNSLFVFGKPMVCVVGFGSNTFDIYILSNRLKKMGWNLNELQNPPSFHLCITNRHTKEIITEFIENVEHCLQLIEEEIKEGVITSRRSNSSSIYGSTQKIENSNILDDVIKVYLNGLHD